MRYFAMTLALIATCVACGDRATQGAQPAAAAPTGESAPTGAASPGPVRGSAQTQAPTLSAAPASRSGDRPAARRSLPPGAATPPPLPEDPAAAQRATAQWQAHLEHENIERQLRYDHRRLAEHRKIVRSLTSLRSGYDRARTPAQLERVQRAAQRRNAEVTAALKHLDPWGVNSRLNAPYAAMLQLLGEPYVNARRDALRGDKAALSAVQSTFSTHMKTVNDWLERAREEDEEFE